MSVDYAWPTELPEDSLVSSPAAVGEGLLPERSVGVKDTRSEDDSS